jgi:5-methylcytosine-specific restriction enzyme A
MPYKSLAKRRRRYRQRRLNDPHWVARYRAYQREYQKKWLRAHPAKRENHRELVKRWRQKHPRKFRAYRRAWRKNNPEKIRDMYKRWYAKHGRLWYQKNRVKRRKQSHRAYRKERRRKLHQQLARRRRYCWKNRERINAKRRRDRLSNPKFYKNLEKRRYRLHRVQRIVSQRNIQARRAGANGVITPDQWRRLLKRHHFRCFYCGTKLLPANRTLDHKIPLSRGGANTIKNVVPACRPCNQRKMRLTAREFLAREKESARKS